MLETPAGPAHAPPFRGAERESGGPLEPAAGLTGRALIAILRRRKLPLLVCALVVPALALTALKRVTPRYTAVGTLIFSGLLVFDTWRLRTVYGPNDYVPAAVNIYLDLLNLFLFLLRILGGGRRS